MLAKLTPWPSNLSRCRGKVGDDVVHADGVSTVSNVPSQAEMLPVRIRLDIRYGLDALGGQLVAFNDF